MQKTTARPEKDATQRVNVHTESASAQRPVRNRQSAAARRPKTFPEKVSEFFARIIAKFLALKRKEKITIISLASVALVLVIVLIITMSSLFAAPQDDGRILRGVIAAGVNIGGMTPEEARTAIETATANTYTELDMSITVLDSTIVLSPADTGARLDIESVINDAYNYGRTGSRSERQQAKNHALANSYIVPISSYLNLNTDYIRSEISKLGGSFTSTLAQPTLSVTGTRPEMGVSKPNTSVAHQTMTIFVGTAEYGLDTEKLFNKVMEYYNINIFQVIGECTVVAPESIEAELLKQYEELCVAPVDAQIDPVTYEIKPEVYGYGFNLDAVKEQIATAPYGTTLEIPLTYIEPNLTQELLSNNLFKDVLAEYTSNLGIDQSWNTNVQRACEALNGVILKSGEVFSFNEHLGELTADRGYTNAMVAIGKKNESVLGGGVTQVASVLYNCALQSGFDILEQKNHVYPTSFILVGHDVYVNKADADLRFRNNLPDPVQFVAKVVNNVVQIKILGSNSRDYIIKIESSIVKTKNPGQLLNYMQPNNPGGYENGAVLQPGIVGYDVEIYRNKYEKNTGRFIDKELITTVKYESRDAVIVRLQNNTPPTTEPSTPETTTPTGTSPTEPSGTSSTESTDPSNATDPSESTGASAANDD